MARMGAMRAVNFPVSKPRFARMPGYYRGAPALIFAFVSPSDRYTDVGDKVVVWFEGGVRIVVVVNSRRHTVTGYRSPIEARILTIDDLLDGEDLVPSW